MPLQATLEPRVDSVDIGGSAMLTCNIEGSPVDRIQWMKDQQIIVMGSSRRVTFPSSESIRIYPVKKEDKGFWQCYAYSDRESVQSIAQVKLGGELHERLIASGREREKG